MGRKGGWGEEGREEGWGAKWVDKVKRRGDEGREDLYTHIYWSRHKNLLVYSKAVWATSGMK